MYLVSVFEDQPVIEASLGGRVDIIEMRTLVEELEELFQDLNGEPFYLLLDYSKAIRFDDSTATIFDTMKDAALEMGAAKVFSVPHETSEIDEHVAPRLQNVLEGKEEFLLHAHQAQFAPLPSQSIALAA